MFGLIQIMAVVVAGGVLLTFTSDAFAGGVSRVVEAALDAIEYRLALRAHRRAEYGAGGRGFERRATLSHAG